MTTLRERLEYVVSHDMADNGECNQRPYYRCYRTIRDGFVVLAEDKLKFIRSPDPEDEELYVILYASKDE